MERKLKNRNRRGDKRKGREREILNPVDIM